jgi:hypothetical protein
MKIHQNYIEFYSSILQSKEGKIRRDILHVFFDFRCVHITTKNKN